MSGLGPLSDAVIWAFTATASEPQTLRTQTSGVNEARATHHPPRILVKAQYAAIVTAVLVHGLAVGRVGRSQVGAAEVELGCAPYLRCAGNGVPGGVRQSHHAQLWVRFPSTVVVVEVVLVPVAHASSAIRSGAVTLAACPYDTTVCGRRPTSPKAG